MNARFAHVLSRLSLVSVVAVSALGAAACNNARTSAPAPVAVEQQAAPAVAQHGPGYRLFRQIEALDLRADQRAGLAEIEQNLAADLSPHRETVRQVAHTLASSLQNGQLDPEEAQAQEAAITAAIAEAKASFAGALNDVHDTLDAGQRAALVEKLRAQHEQHRGRYTRGEGEAHEGGPMSNIAFQLGLTEEQKQALREAFQKSSEEIFPDRKARREAWEAKMKALGDSFVTDDFDAADHDFGGGADEAIRSFGEATRRAIEISGKVLTDEQRLMVASMIRDKAQKI